MTTTEQVADTLTGGPWIQTFTGRKFFPLAPLPGSVCLEDIAHALANKCRFTGHCRDFYSVAQHSVLVSEVVASEGGTVADQIGGLFHDACEAYGPDFAKPVKHHYTIQGGTLIADHEDHLTEIILSQLGLPTKFNYELVKKADMILLLTEARDLMGPPPEPWQLKADYLWNTIDPAGPAVAKAAFTARAKKLMRELEDEASAIPSPAWGKAAA